MRNSRRVGAETQRLITGCPVNLRARRGAESRFIDAAAQEGSGNICSWLAVASAARLRPGDGQNWRPIPRNVDLLLARLGLAC